MYKRQVEEFVDAALPAHGEREEERLADANGRRAVGGERGVDKLFDILEEELRVAMALTGCASLDDITADVVCARP